MIYFFGEEYVKKIMGCQGRIVPELYREELYRNQPAFGIDRSAVL
jgi:hypothetical protein